jgi:hypothetical protein
MFALRMANPETFSLEAANALLPRIRRLCERQFARRRDIEAALAGLGEKTGESSTVVTISQDDDAAVREMKRNIVSLVEGYRAGWREIEDLGVVVKDPRVGLVDFLGELDGSPVYFCWRYGEDGVRHYHSLHEGFSGRKEIVDTTRKNLLN